MTSKDYVLIASILFEANRHLTWRKASAVLDHACALLKEDNSNFDRAKFEKEVALPVKFMKKTLKGQ